MKRIGAVVAFCTMFCGYALGQAAASDVATAPLGQAIAAQPLSQALDRWARLSGLQVIYGTQMTNGKMSPGAPSGVDAREGLDDLLKGSGLSATWVNSRTATLSAATGVPAEGGKEGKNDSSRDFPLAQVDQTGAGSQVRTSGQHVELDEIVVTAQKREERLQDVPVPVTAVSGAQLVENNQLKLEDYYSSIPGLSMSVTDYGAPVVSIRGLTTGGLGSYPTVGIVVDDVPFANHAAAFPTEVPDLDPSDLSRVEVLRGPQGTLYGASSMGGLVKFVTVDPSTDGLSGRVQAGTSSVHNGPDLGYSVRGSINMPLSDTLAARASAFSREDPGYIDNVETGQRGVNKRTVDGGRLALLWRPSSSVTLKLSALVQKDTAGGSSGVVVDPNLGDLQQSNVRGSGRYDKRLEVFTANLSAKIAGVDLTSVSGYAVNTVDNSYDFTRVFGPLTQYGYPTRGFDGFGVTGSNFLNNSKTNNFTQEIRLSAPIGQAVEWVLGGFFDYEREPVDVSSFYAEQPATGEVVGSWLFAPSNLTTYAEYAAFADLTWHVTQRFDVQIGGRESHTRYSQGAATFVGPYVPVFLGGTSPKSQPGVASSDNAFTYVVTPRFKISPDLMAYVRLASGFRPGGPNAGATVPPSYKPDKTRNYDLGLKGDFLNHRLSVDASLFYIDWKDIQLAFTGTAAQGYAGYIGNGSAAKSQGAELAVESRPLAGLTIAAWIDYTKAELTRAFAPNNNNYAVAGDRLPYSSRYSGNLSLRQEFPLPAHMTGFVGGEGSYVGDRVGEFTPSPQRQLYPAYVKIDLRAGVQYDTWAVNFFLNNLTDKRGLLHGGLGSFDSQVFYYIQPRTVGVSVAKTFP